MVLIYDVHPEKTSEIDVLNNAFRTRKNVMCVVHRPGCPACEQFIPNWDTFATNMKKKKEDVVLAKIHVKTLPMVDLPEKEFIQGVPHIVLHGNHKNHEYMGNRTPQDLEKWLRAHTMVLSGGKKLKRSLQIRKTKRNRRKTQRKVYKRNAKTKNKSSRRK